MSAYSELIKNFEKIRAYMREFYVYGFKSRDDYNKKSARSYDDERRRLESWLGEHMSFQRTPEGKNVFISIDSRSSFHNPLYKAWKSKSFTDGDITLHFIIFDILHSPEVSLTLSEIMGKIDGDYLSYFESPMVFDESTIRKKLKEYTEEGIIISEKKGRTVYYKRAEDKTNISDLDDVLDFYSEVSPCGVVGSYIIDKAKDTKDLFAFKHHYITSVLDSGVMAELFTAMRKKCAVTVHNHSRRRAEPTTLRLVPLRIFISVQNGRQHLIAYQPDGNRITSLRLDYISKVKIEEPTPRFDELRSMLDTMQSKMWGVMANYGRNGEGKTEHVEFTVKIKKGEEFIIKRLEREKRCGNVEKIDDNTYRFTADVYDTNEMIPWIRTFICRIEKMNFSNRTQENRFLDDLREMYKMYGIEGGGNSDIQ